MVNKSAVKRLCEKVKRSSGSLALVSSKTKDVCLIFMAKALVANTSYILRENKKDLIIARRKKLSKALIDRLSLDRLRVKSMADSLVEISKLRDPVGATIATIKRPNGLFIKKVRVPIGVILIIYESRPDVTADCI